MGDRTVPFDEDEVCDVCGREGAYDFMGDLICDQCIVYTPDELEEDDMPNWHIWKHKPNLTTGDDPGISYYINGSEADLRDMLEDHDGGPEPEVEVCCIRNHAKSDSGVTHPLTIAPPAGFWPVTGVLKYYYEDGPPEGA